ncbi:tetratricopeptide repeat protein 23 [Aulostomus maculatus]
MGSSRRIGASPPCDSDVARPSRTGHGKKGVTMMAPHEKLRYVERRAQHHEDNGQFDACIHDLVRCVALTRLAFGEGHVKVGQAHARLAKAYLQFKGWGLQASEHASLAREQLPFCSPSSSCRGEKLEVLSCLLSIHLTQGGAALLTTQYPSNYDKGILSEAESSYLEAKQILEELHQHGGNSQEEKMKTELEVFTGLSRVYKRQNKPEEALNQCEKSLQLLKDADKPEKTCLVYREMASIEQDRGYFDRAIAHLSEAHAIAVSHSPEELEGAQISHSLALILAATAEPQHNDSAGRYFEESLHSYKNIVGPQGRAFLTAQDDFCRFLLLSGQQERCVEIQRASLSSKRSTFGDLSAEVADTLQLIGSVEMTEGRMSQAHGTMIKCLEIQTLLYGPQHKKTKATQKAVDILTRAPEVAERLLRQSRKKSKPPSRSVPPSSCKD